MFDEMTQVSQEQTQLAAYVKTKADYYLPRWAPLISSGSGRAGWNWAAFFLGAFWFPYRKMYKATFLLYAVSIGEFLLEQAVFVGIMGLPEPPLLVSAVATFTIAGVCGLYANSWYLSHVRGKVEEAERQGHSGNDLLRSLAARGGTSLAASVGIFVGFVAGGSAVLLAFGIAVMVLLNP